MRHAVRFTLFLVTLAMGTSACGGATPAGPTGSGSGATITGAVISETGSPNVPGLVVNIAGTGISATVNGANRFTLQNVPSGSVQVSFTAPSVSGAITLASVQPAETIDLAVLVAGATVALESANRSHGNESELEGRVEALPPTTPAGTFVVAGHPVITNSSTRFFLRDGEPGTFADLAIGVRVEVKGTRSGDSLTAATVKIQNMGTDLPVELHGIIQGLSGTAAAFQFTLGDRLVKGDSATVFDEGGHFSDLANGKRVEVKGQQRDGFVYARRIQVNGVDDDDEVEIEGLLTSKTGTNPNFTLIVGGRSVRTSAATIVRMDDATVTLLALVVGQKLEIEASRQTDGTILARKIKIEDDEIEVTGALTSKTGTAPNLTLIVG